MFAASALSRRETAGGLTRAAVIGGLPSRSTSTTGAAQHMPLQPAATTVQAAPLNLDAQRLQRVGGADREPTRADADGESSAGAPTLGVAPQHGEARAGRARRRRRGGRPASAG